MSGHSLYNDSPILGVMVGIWVRGLVPLVSKVMCHVILLCLIVCNNYMGSIYGTNCEIGHSLYRLPNLGGLGVMVGVLGM